MIHSNILRRIASVAATFLVLGSGLAFANTDNAEKKNAKDCSKYLEVNDDLTVDTQVLNETHSLYDLIDSDPTKNLAVQHPSIVMNAFQRNASWILFGGVKSIPNPEYGPTSINYYPVFSHGIPEANGKMIVGQHRPIQAYVDFIMAGARGDGSASKVMMFNGPAGTGKTEFLNIQGNLAQNLTATKPEHFMYVTGWKNLKGFGEVYPVLNIQTNSKGEEFEHPLMCPLQDSPFTLLPTAYQDAVLKLASPAAKKLAKVDPTPKRKPCPQCSKVKEIILKQYMAEHKLKALTAKQELDAIAPHVDVKRFIVGTNGNFPKINAEGKDVDYAGLFFRENAFISNSFGTSHPFSYHLDGKVLRANGQMLSLDEFFRNVPELRDVFLEIIENKIVVRGGAPAIHLDSVIVGASNNELIDKAKSEGAGKAHIDRVRLVPMNYQLTPHEIAKTMLLMKGMNNVIQQKLEHRMNIKKSEDDQFIEEDENTASEESLASEKVSKPEPGNLHDLFPLYEKGSGLLSPDYRFNVWINSGGENPVHISPHTLLYMGAIVSATRLSTDIAKAKKLMPNAKVVGSTDFTSLTSRMKILMKELTPKTVGEGLELQELSVLLREGSFGLSARDAANVWLTQAIAEAARPENGNCLTPILARKVFEELLASGVIQHPESDRLKWMQNSDLFAKSFLVPAIETDFHQAVVGLGSVENIYNEVFDELRALNADRSATTYQSSDGDILQINRPRLVEIESIYFELTKRSLSVGEIVSFHSTNGMKTNQTKHQELLKAISSYLAKRSTDALSFGDLEKLARGDGNAEIRSKYAELNHVMRHQLGYCDKCMKSALTIAKQAASPTTQVK